MEAMVGALEVGQIVCLNGHAQWGEQGLELFNPRAVGSPSQPGAEPIGSQPQQIARLDPPRSLDLAQERDAFQVLGAFLGLGPSVRLAWPEQHQPLLGHQQPIVGVDGIGVVGGRRRTEVNAHALVLEQGAEGLKLGPEGMVIEVTPPYGPADLWMERPRRDEHDVAQPGGHGLGSIMFEHHQTTSQGGIHTRRDTFSRTRATASVWLNETHSSGAWARVTSPGP